MKHGDVPYSSYVSSPEGTIHGGYSLKTIVMITTLGIYHVWIIIQCNYTQKLSHW